MVERTKISFLDKSGSVIFSLQEEEDINLVSGQIGEAEKIIVSSQQEIKIIRK